MSRWEPGSRQLSGDEVPDGLHDLGGLFGVRLMERVKPNRMPLRPSGMGG